MSKWNKPDKPLSEEFLQNEQRRRQMIVEASKRRREKQRKLQELNENLKKNEQEALQKHKKEKQEAYSKYLKNNNNMHDKYEQIKRNEKMQEEPKREVSKWKRKDNSETKFIEGLDLERSHGKMAAKQVGNKDKAKGEWVKEEQKQHNLVKKGSENKKVVEQQFEKQWAEEEVEQEMIGSKLIDSLDLDIDTLERGKQLSRKIEEIKHKNQEKPTIEQSEVEEIKNLIGYDSMLVSMDNCTEKLNVKQPISNKNINTNTKQKPVAQKKQANEQQTFHNLKHKKQAKILEWINSNNIAEEADDLFSNCSSNKNSLANKQNNSNNIKSSKKILETIPQKRNSANKETEKQKKNSTEKPQMLNTQADKKLQPINKNSSADKISNNSQQKKQSKQNNEANRFAKVKESLTGKNTRKIPQISQQNQSNRNRSVSKQKIKENQAALQRQRQKSLEKLKQRKFSNEKPSSAQKLRSAAAQQDRPQVPKTQQPFRIANKIPPIPSKPTYTVATHEQYFDVQSFIKNDLLQLNEQERQLQEQIRNIHLNNKQKMKEIESKHQIKTNYKNSAQLINRHQNPDANNQDYSAGYAQQYQYNNNLNQDLIEESLQKLDDLLIKREIQSRQKTNQISQQSHLKSEQKSIINPFSRPEDLHKQILQLAENISKFENEPVSQDVKGYGYQRKIKKKQQKSKQQIPEEISVSRNIDQQGVKRPSMKINNPPVLSYSSKNNEIVDVDLEGGYYDPEDSLQTGKKQKVQVNEKLRNMLFDD